MVFQNLATFNGQPKARPEVSEPRQVAEKKLVKAAKRGHAPAFAALCEQYAQRLFHTAHRITKSRQDAEDTVQDALLRAFVHLADFNEESGFGTWLTRIAINSALMILRKKRASLEVAMEGTIDFDADKLSYEIADRAPDPEKRYARKEGGRILNRAIERLRPRLREVVEIQRLQEYSIRETAEAAGISVAAAKARLFHAKAALRRSPILKPMQQTRSGGQMRALSAA